MKKITGLKSIIAIGGTIRRMGVKTGCTIRSSTIRTELNGDKKYDKRISTISNNEKIEATI